MDYYCLTRDLDQQLNLPSYSWLFACELPCRQSGYLETKRTTVELRFCFPWTISVCIMMCIWGYYVAERSTHNQVSVFWQRQIYFKLTFPGSLWNSLLIFNISPWTASSKTAPKHQWSAITFNSGFQVLFFVVVLFNQMWRWCAWPKSSFFLTSNHYYRITFVVSMAFCKVRPQLFCLALKEKLL